MTLSTWLTNRCVNPSMRLNHQLEKDVGYKFFQFITWWRSWSSLVTKPYGVQTQQLLQEKGELEQILSLIIICMNKILLHTCATFDGPKNNPYICLELWEKKAQTYTHGLDENQLWKTEFHKSRQIGYLLS